MKKIIYLIVFLSVISIASAWSYGQIVSQSQLNNFNIISIDLGEHFVRNTNNEVKYNCIKGICEFNISFDALKKYVTYDEDGNIIHHVGEYEVMQINRTIFINIIPYNKLAEETNLTYAKQKLANHLKSRRDRIAKGYKIRMLSWQTQDNNYSDLLKELKI